MPLPPVHLQRITEQGNQRCPPNTPNPSKDFFFKKKRRKKKKKKLTGALQIIIAHKQNIGQTSSENTVSAK
jgi:hypothetical protein